MKILFLGDYSGFHSTLAKQLRAEGRDCTVVSGGSGYMNTARDISLTRRPGKVSGAKYLLQALRLLPKLKGYDVVELINPGFFDLRPEKLKYFFDRLKKQNGIISLTLAGTDSNFVKAMTGENEFRHTDYRVGEVPTEYAVKFSEETENWLQNPLADYCRYVYDSVDGAVSGLYEYHVAAEKYLNGKPLVYGGIPVDTEVLKFTEFSKKDDEKINLFVGIKREYAEFKGTDRLLSAAKEIERRFPDRCEVTVVENVPLAEYLQKMDKADVILDQIYSYTPATNALQAMAKGKIAVSGGEPEFYDFIGEQELMPIVNALPDDEELKGVLENLVTKNGEELREMSVASRRFIEKHNSSAVVAKRFLSAWEKMAK